MTAKKISTGLVLTIFMISFIGIPIVKNVCEMNKKVECTCASKKHETEKCCKSEWKIKQQQNDFISSHTKIDFRDVFLSIIDFKQIQHTTSFFLKETSILSHQEIPNTSYQAIHSIWRI